MREIKFRAWEKELKEIIPVHNIDFEKKMINTENVWRSFDEIELMQYTGLKDKGGKEIFEGDIYKNSSGILWVIYFCEKTARFLADAINRDYEEKIIVCRGESMNGVVVGNIYEHPHLLVGATE